MSTPTITGIHHVTAIASDPQQNLSFYTEVLGLRLVKLTVNFDDPGTYHFYFGDGAGAPGSILTFFPWPGARRGAVGNGQVSATSFAVPATALGFWRDRLSAARVPVEDQPARFGEPVLRFADPDGLPLECIGVAVGPAEHLWAGGDIAAAHAIRGFHSATLSEEGYERTAALLQDVMGWTLVGSEGARFRYRAAASADGRAGLVDVLCTPDGRWGRSGAGTVHHIAWRTPDDTQQQAWRARLVDGGYNVSPIMDRTYFHSIYYREPGGILFEIATDPPGFALDEPADRLGERLMLPAQYEPHRAVLERALPALQLPHQGARGTTGAAS
jgi:glyoxalase family protein